MVKLYSHVSIVLKILYFMQTNLKLSIVNKSFFHFHSFYYIQPLLATCFTGPVPPKTKQRVLISEIRICWYRTLAICKKNHPHSGRSFLIRISTSACPVDNNLKPKWLLLILPRKSSSIHKNKTYFHWSSLSLCLSNFEN